MNKIDGVVTSLYTLVAIILFSFDHFFGGCACLIPGICELINYHFGRKR